MTRRQLAAVSAACSAGLVLVLVVGRHDAAGVLAGAALVAYVAVTVLVLRRGGRDR